MSRVDPGGTRTFPTGLFEQFVEFAPDAVVGIGHDGRIVLANAQTEGVFGYARAQLLGQPVERLVPEGLRDPDPRTRPTGLGRRSDGTEFPAEISLSDVETQDGPLIIAAIRDITDRAGGDREKARLEVQLDQLRRLESVGQLAGGIAHDFNNLLGVILNYAQFVADEIGPASPVHADVGEISRAAGRAAALTRQLLIFCRHDGVHPEVLDLNVVVSDLDRLLRGALGAHVAIETRLAPDAALVEADAGQLEQVLVNLAVNARDAMPSGGRLVIETARVELAEGIGDLAPGRAVRLAVSDTGVGMRPEVAERAFEAFFSTKPETVGTGLGLTTVHGIVSGAGGHIHVDSEPGLGTTVAVYLPASTGPAAPPQHEPADRAEPPGHGATVLVVEHEESLRAVTERILGGAGYTVVTACGAAAALAACEDPEQPIDLVLTDVTMPEMHGPELVERAARIRPGLRFLFMSGYIHEAAQRLGMVGPDHLAFVEKPFSAAELLTRVRVALAARG